MPWGRRVRKLCRVAAAGGSPGGDTPQGGVAWCFQGPGSGRCSPGGPREAPLEHTGTEFLGGILQNPEGGVEEGSWAVFQPQRACWGVGAHWGLVVPVGTEEAAWSDDQNHQALKEEEDDCIS